jgi:hypothetical protein
MDGALLGALSALGGSSIGALASVGTTWLTQHYQGRMQQQSQESARRERLFGEFITQASALYADALTHDRPDPSKLVSLYAVKAQLGLFASPPSIDCAEEALQLIVDTYCQPNADFSSREALRTRKGSTHSMVNRPAPQSRQRQCRPDRSNN